MFGILNHVSYCLVGKRNHLCEQVNKVVTKRKEKGGGVKILVFVVGK